MMPIDTRVEGDPVSIRASADWLGRQLSTAVDNAVTGLFAARDEAESGWRGDAGPVFRDRMDTGGRDADALRGDVDRVATAFHAYADGLVTARSGMEQAREIARDGGLHLDGDTILDPGPARAEAPAEAESTGTEDHQARLTTYAQAEEQAAWARNGLDLARATLTNVLGDLRSKPVLVAAGFVNDGIVGALAQKHVSVLKAQGAAMMEESRTAAARYLKAPGGSAEAKALNALSWTRYLESDTWQRSALRAGSKVEARLPLIGLAVTAVDVGYDIKTGKPVGKAIISGTSGLLGAAAAGAALGSVFPGVGTVAGAAIGVVGGMLASGAADAVYDDLSQGTKDAIEDGFAAVGHGLTDAGGAVAHSARKVWDSIF
ncbi:hypothetical protein [Actinoplanes sp. HUAS TT8]|uniref:hypothetical protein n=1 Tax=Actinoplanes sp. HUAS TT8 TaxID=3447453 RepID=UPI003F51C91A